jgi:hypothetical protein
MHLIVRTKAPNCQTNALYLKSRVPSLPMPQTELSRETLEVAIISAFRVSATSSSSRWTCFPTRTRRAHGLDDSENNHRCLGRAALSNDVIEADLRQDGLECLTLHRLCAITCSFAIRGENSVGIIIRAIGVSSILIVTVLIPGTDASPELACTSSASFSAIRLWLSAAQWRDLSHE